MTSPIVSMEFVIPNDEEKTFHIVNPHPVDVNSIHPEAKDSNTSYGYSGRHDHGQLPLLRRDGEMANVISALAEAKSISDRYLSPKIDAVYGYQNKNSEISHPEGATEGGMDVSDEEADGSSGERSAKKKRTARSN